MKKFKVLAVVLMLVLCAAMFAACDGGKPEASATPAPSATPEAQKIAMKPGDTYKIYFVENKTENLWVDGETIGVRAQSFREKWLNFQEEYGVTVTWIKPPFEEGSSAWWSDVTSAANSGEPVCDLFNMGGPCFIPQSITVNGSVASHLYEDLSLYEDYTNFDDAGLWDQSAIEAVGYYGDKLHIVVPTDYGFNGVGGNMVTYFSGALLENGGHSADEIYNLYQEGNWTWDQFRQMCIDCADIDKGVYGTTTTRNYLSVYALIYANGASVLGKDAETGAPKFIADSNEALAAVNFFIKLAKDDKVVLTDGGFWQEEAPYFRDGKSVFMITYANRVIEGMNTGATTILDNSDTLKYGIVLPPKGPNATDYVSEKNWYTPWAAFKGHENMAGVVQCLSMYVAPEYAPDSAEAMMILDSEASIYFDDERSIQTLKDIIKKNITTDYMVWWDLGADSGMNGVGELTTLKMAAWIVGETTPEQTYAENKDALNAYFANYVGANS